jgi:hypothetical protein
MYLSFKNLMKVMQITFLHKSFCTCVILTSNTRILISDEKFAVKSFLSTVKYE